jgi:hypothetical protein
MLTTTEAPKKQKTRCHISRPKYFFGNKEAQTKKLIPKFMVKYITPTQKSYSQYCRISNSSTNANIPHQQHRKTRKLYYLKVKKWAASFLVSFHHW